MKVIKENSNDILKYFHIKLKIYIKWFEKQVYPISQISESPDQVSKSTWDAPKWYVFA